MGLGNFKPLFVPEGGLKDGKYMVPLQIYEDDLCKIWRYEIFFQNCIEKGYRPRPAILQKYFHLLERARQDNLNARVAFIKNIKCNVLERCRGKVYDFNIENSESSIAASLFSSRKGVDSKILRNYNLTEFLDIFFNNNMHDDELLKINNEKAAFMEYAYTKLHQYLIKVPEEKQPSFYSRTVIVGYLAAAFGMLVSEENYHASPGKPLYYTSFLNNMARHSCIKAKKKLSTGIDKPQIK